MCFTCSGHLKERFDIKLIYSVFFFNIFNIFNTYVHVTVPVVPQVPLRIGQLNFVLIMIYSPVTVELDFSLASDRLRTIDLPVPCSFDFSSRDDTVIFLFTCVSRIPPGPLRSGSISSGNLILSDFGHASVCIA